MTYVSIYTQEFYSVLYPRRSHFTGEKCVHFFFVHFFSYTYIENAPSNLPDLYVLLTLQFTLYIYTHAMCVYRITEFLMKLLIDMEMESLANRAVYEDPF